MTDEEYIQNQNAHEEAIATSASHGGARPNSGRKRSPNAPRCPCGAMTVARAKHQGHKCQAETANTKEAR